MVPPLGRLGAALVTLTRVFVVGVLVATAIWTFYEGATEPEPVQSGATWVMGGILLLLASLLGSAQPRLVARGVQAAVLLLAALSFAVGALRWSRDEPDLAVVCAAALGVLAGIRLLMVARAIRLGLPKD